MSGKLDHKDVSILRKLKADSRTPLSVIGDSMGASKATVSRRLSRMEDEGIISNYSVNIDLSSSGVMKSLMMMQVSGTISQVIEQLKGYKEIGSIYKTFGDHNLICEVYTRSVDELYQMIQDKVLKIMSVRNVEVDVIIDSTTFNGNADIDLYEELNKE